MKIKLPALLLGSLTALTVATAAMALDKTVKIGVLNDQSGLYADVTGPNSVLAAQMAIEDSGWSPRDGKSMSSSATTSQAGDGVNIRAAVVRPRHGGRPLSTFRHRRSGSRQQYRPEKTALPQFGDSSSDLPTASARRTQPLAYERKLLRTAPARAGQERRRHLVSS